MGSQVGLLAPKDLAFEQVLLDHLVSLKEAKRQVSFKRVVVEKLMEVPLDQVDVVHGDVAQGLEHQVDRPGTVPFYSDLERGLATPVLEEQQVFCRDLGILESSQDVLELLEVVALLVEDGLAVDAVNVHLSVEVLIVQNRLFGPPKAEK
jgi:hypothetical protein